MGGKVPYSYYLSNSAPVAKDYMETMNIIAGSGGCKKLKYKVDVANSILRCVYYMSPHIDHSGTSTVHDSISFLKSYRIIFRWEFMTEGGDIGFRVYFKSVDEGTVDLVPLSRIESHLVTEEGELICINPGECKRIYY